MRGAAILAAAVAAALAALGATPARAQQDTASPAVQRAERELAAPVPLTPEQESRALHLEGMLKCPVCRSQSVRQSGSFMAEDMQRKIRELIAAGRSDEEIKDYFVARYGDWILLTPPKSGFNLTAYLIPFVAVLAGGLGLFVAARRWSRKPGSSRPRPEAPPPSSPYLARLERELEETE